MEPPKSNQLVPALVQPFYKIAKRFDR